MTVRARHPITRGTVYGRRAFPFACMVPPLTVLRSAMRGFAGLDPSAARWAEALQLVQALHGLHRLQRGVVDVRRVQAAALLERIFRQRRQERLELLLHRNEEPDVVG